MQLRHLSAARQALVKNVGIRATYRAAHNLGYSPAALLNSKIRHRVVSDAFSAMPNEGCYAGPVTRTSPNRSMAQCSPV